MSTTNPTPCGRHPGCIMILGATNDEHGNLSLMSTLRLSQGALEYKRHCGEGMKILLTGGYGAHFNTTSLPHWHYAENFLKSELAIPSDAILPEKIESAHTVADFEKAVPIFKKYNFERVILVTSAFHTERALYIARHTLPVAAKAITVAPASDEALDREMLAKAQAHELRAVEYLKAHYPPAGSQAKAE